VCYNLGVPILPSPLSAGSLLELPVQCQEIRNASDFSSLEPEYHQLYARSPQATLYQSYCWISNWLHTFAGAQTRPHLITIRKHGRLIGCAPLVMRRPAGMPFRRLEPIGVLRSDYMDLLLEAGAEQEALAGFERHLSLSRKWDLLDMQQLPEDSPTLSYFRENQERLGCLVNVQETCPYAPLPKTWEAYLAGLGKKNRYNVGYYRRLLERDFTLWIGRVSLEDMDVSMEELFRLHQLRWRKRRLPGALFNPRVREFHRRVAADLLSSHQLDLYRMDLDGQTVAMLYCFAESGRGYYYLGGFDPAFARYSVGTVLTAYAIQQSISRGHTVFDFLRGAEPYKYRWNVQEKLNYRVEWMRGGLGSRALCTLNQATRAIEHRAKLIAHKLERSA